MPISAISNDKNETTQNQVLTRKNPSRKKYDAILSFKRDDKKENEFILNRKKSSDVKESKESWFSKNAVSIGFGLASIVALTALIRDVYVSKKLADVSAKLVQTTNELNTTKELLADAEGVIKQIQQIANTPEKMSVKKTLATIIRNATKGLKLTNELGSECTRFGENIGKLRNII